MKRVTASLLRDWRFSIVTSDNINENKEKFQYGDLFEDLHLDLPQTGFLLEVSNKNIYYIYIVSGATQPMYP